jgi:hypothetical protein
MDSFVHVENVSTEMSAAAGSRLEEWYYKAARPLTRAARRRRAPPRDSPTDELDETREQLA